MTRSRTAASSKVVRITSEFEMLRNFDPLSTFAKYRSEGADTESYLLESLAGPTSDARLSMIGFAPLFSVELRGRQVTFQGSEEVISVVMDRCAENGFITPARHVVSLSSSEHIWPLLRTIECVFDLSVLPYQSWKTFGWFGYLGYDIAGSIEKLPRIISDGPDHPDLRLTVFQGELALNHSSGSATLRWFRPLGSAASAVDSRLQWMKQSISPWTVSTSPVSVPPPNEIISTIDREQYEEKVRAALEHIYAGDIYQVQLGHEVRIRSQADPFDVYQRLRSRNPSPYMYFASVGDTTLIGASPELFVRCEQAKVTMRPIAGTKTAGSDRSDFVNDEKEVAEHVMLVDLCRNDLSRVIEANSLEVENLFSVEDYSHVCHLVSTVSGRRRASADKYEIVASGFPAGTMTGAPKIRAMEIIEDLEVSRRGLYAGAVGKISFQGEINLALCIRSAFLKDGIYSLRASAGVVADSTPEGEWEETWNKMAACYWALTGSEVHE